MAVVVEDGNGTQIDGHNNWKLELPEVILHFKSDILFAKGLPFQPLDGEVRAREQRPEGPYELCILLKIVECLFEGGGETLDATACAFFVRVVAGVNQGW